MILQLISPEERFEYNCWEYDKAPAVVVVTDEVGIQRVWVRGANVDQYFEQLGVVEVFTPELARIDEK